MNPWRTVIINYVRQLLGDEKASEFVPVISRAMVGLPAQHDAKDFAKLIQTAYESGFEKAFSQYQAKMKELGYKMVYNRIHTLFFNCFRMVLSYETNKTFYFRSFLYNVYSYFCDIN